MRNPFFCAWEMYASAAEGKPLSFFGPLGFALQNREPKRVAMRVRVTIVDDPEPGDYWAWMDHGASQPSCIHATEADMTRQFLLGQQGAPGPREEQEAGLGEMVRLRVTVLGPVSLPEKLACSRPDISSAM